MLETFAELFSDLLLTALVFLEVIFFVSVVAMLKNFLTHGLSGKERIYGWRSYTKTK